LNSALVKEIGKTKLKRGKEKIRRSSIADATNGNKDFRKIGSLGTRATYGKVQTGPKDRRISGKPASAYYRKDESASLNRRKDGQTSSFRERKSKPEGGGSKDGKKVLVRRTIAEARRDVFRK